MSPYELTLWNKIKAFQLDDQNIAFTFSDRLARENGWNRAFAIRVVEEYKKFLFLCCITQTGVTPSDPVDQAWHLHLTYTKSYWVDLCRHTLEKEIHHNPTEGGKKEAKKFDNFYTSTRQLYKEKFGQEPPKDIWQDNHTRFSDIRFQRVNLNRYWLIKKPSFRKNAVIATGIALFAFLSIQATNYSTWIPVCVVIILWIVAYKNRGKGGGGSSCSTSSCSTSSCSSDSGHSGHHSDSGCSSGCSGCTSSGCSGCGGGGD